MIVWRVEKEDHSGPFQSTTEFLSLCYATTPDGREVFVHEDNHPAAREDFTWGEFSGSYYFGCKSFKDLRHWFGTQLIVEYLQKYTFKVVQYECEEHESITGKSDIQLAFGLMHAIRKNIFDMNVLLREEEPA